MDPAERTATREVATTSAFRLREGAEIYGGRYDGRRVDRVHIDAPPRDRARVVLLLDDGTEWRCDTGAQIRWLHPAGRSA